MQHARDRLRELTDRSRFRVPVETVVQEMNWFLNGWAAYFRYGNSARRFAQLQWYAQMRLGLFLSKRYGRGRDSAGGWWAFAHQPGCVWPALLGPLSPPDRTGRGGKGRMPAVNGVG